MEAMTDELCRFRSTFLGDHIHLTMRRAAVGMVGPYDMEAVRRRLQPEVARSTGSGSVEAVDSAPFLAVQSLNHRHGAGGGNALLAIAILPPVIGPTGSGAVVTTPK